MSENDKKVILTLGIAAFIVAILASMFISSKDTYEAPSEQIDEAFVEQAPQGVTLEEIERLEQEAWCEAHPDQCKG